MASTYKFVLILFQAVNVDHLCTIALRQATRHSVVRPTNTPCSTRIASARS